jgi:hypothetical protein
MTYRLQLSQLFRNAGRLARQRAPAQHLGSPPSCHRRGPVIVLWRARSASEMRAQDLNFTATETPPAPSFRVTVLSLRALLAAAIPPLSFAATFVVGALNVTFSF